MYLNGGSGKEVSFSSASTQGNVAANNSACNFTSFGVYSTGWELRHTALFGGRTSDE